MELKKEIELLSKIKNEVHNSNGILLNLYISGSNLYGWSSKDSDTDIRGCFALRKEEFLGLKKPREVIELKGIKDTDIVLFELKKVVDLAIKGNCNILEEFNAPQIYNIADFIKLKELVNNSFGKKGIYGSYKGMAEFNYQEFILHGRNTIKKYLYVFRGLMAGIYCLQTGIIKPNIKELNKYFKIPEVKKLLELKIKGRENEPLKEVNQGKLDHLIKELFEKIDKAYLKSKIPEEPSRESAEKINNFIINLRLNLK